MQKHNTILINPRHVPTTLERRIADAKGKIDFFGMGDGWLNNVRSNSISSALNEYALFGAIGADPIPDLRSDEVFGKYFDSKGMINEAGIAAANRGMDHAKKEREHKEAANFMRRVRELGLFDGYLNMLARTIADTAKFGDEYLKFKLEIITRAANSRARGGIVLYPGFNDDLAGALLIPSPKYVFYDPIWKHENQIEKLEEWTYSVTTYASRQNEWFEIEMPAKEENIRAKLKLGHEGMAFEFSPCEFFSTQGWDEGVFAVIVKKPSGSLHGSLKGEGMDALAKKIAPGGFLLYSDWQGYVNEVKPHAERNGLVPVAKGELNCERACSDGEIEGYPAVLFEKK